MLFRACYERGLARNSGLAGSVSARFVIQRDGSVGNVSSTAESTLPDAEVTRCVLDGYAGMKFPHPKGGIVTVIYPIQLRPG